MNLGTLPKRKWKVTLGSILRGLLATGPVVWVGAVWLGSLGGGAGATQFGGAKGPEAWSALWPNAGALLAGALLLVPFGLSTLRLRRRG